MDNLGVDCFHGIGFSHELPNGFPFWVFLHMATPHLVNQGSEMLLADAGTCIIYPPNHPRYLYVPAGADGVCNNWIHFCVSNDADFIKYLAELAIPIDQFFTLRHYMPIIAALQELLYEHNLALCQRDRMINARMDEMLIQISRNIVPYQAPVDVNAMQHLYDFEQLRKQIYSTPEKPWSVKSLAAQVYLGANQFIVLYRNFFDVTPKHDLIHARIVKAKSLLNESSTLRDVALACGFKNEYYFSSTFKKAVGVSPGQYAKNKSTR